MPKLYFSKNRYIVEGLALSNITMQSLQLGEIFDVDIKIRDQRQISDAQRGLIFALCEDIESYSGHDREEIRTTAMVANDIPTMNRDYCSVTDANLIISTLIQYCIDNRIPFRRSTRSQFEFTEKQTYMLTVKRQCVICGTDAHIHHYNCRVGMGRNRDKISHVGMEVLPLCADHHKEAHAIGDINFAKKYHVNGIKVDERLNRFIKTGKIEIFKDDLEDNEVQIND